MGGFWIRENPTTEGEGIMRKEGSSNIDILNVETPSLLSYLCSQKASIQSNSPGRRLETPSLGYV